MSDIVDRLRDYDRALTVKERAKTADEIERLRGLLMESRVCVRAELGEYEAFLKRPGMHPDAYVFGNRRLGEVDNLLARIDAALRQLT